MCGYSWKFVVGMILLLTNQPVGWGGVALCAYLAKKKGKKVYLAYGTALYALSWAMFIAGAVLAGPEGVAIAKKVMKSYGLEALLILAAIVAGVIIYVRFRKKKK